MNEVTRILSAVGDGDPRAADQLLPLVYDELKKLAAQKMAQESPGQTLQATALVHEAYLRLVDVKQAQHWNSGGHFCAAAAEARCRTLVEQARHKASAKAGGTVRRVDRLEVDPARQGLPIDVLALNEALDKWNKAGARAAAVVKRRFFAGLTTPQAAEALGVPLTNAENDWEYAKSYLRLQLSDHGDAGLPR